jgi:hypothetical protein
MGRRIDLAGGEAIDDRVDTLDVRESIGKFLELSLGGIDVEQVAAVRTLFDLGDRSLSASEANLVADLEVIHFSSPTVLLASFIE